MQYHIYVLSLCSFSCRSVICADNRFRIRVQALKLLQQRRMIHLFVGRYNLIVYPSLPDNMITQSTITKDIEWLRSITSLPILIKGVLTAEDAIKAMEIGVAGIVVSNHGARQLDYSPASITVLEQVVRAVGGKIPVLIDGGVRRGTDIFKALALGAQAVLIGRPILYGLAAKGEYGVQRVIEMLKAELELTMALSGCPTLKDITRSHVRTEQDRLNCRL
ncbi:hypothetical protein RHMOL_Rhmol08G0318000 [Rhododendron molle]|uniref:Uncharacterized protein n=1 Tax=Rhododendron molle TaxID=49168 RepID=A0ACC0MUL8_RHOML|nr:hypothetical protein RHMOL_Rhmol08G0318000 [Rhododendron molle]